jgi:hypothetical protein
MPKEEAIAIRIFPEENVLVAQNVTPVPHEPENNTNCISGNLCFMLIVFAVLGLPLIVVYSARMTQN